MRVKILQWLLFLCELVQIQSESNCTITEQHSTYIRCCPIKELSSVDNINDCIAFCALHNTGNETNLKPCRAVNLHLENKECHLLHFEEENKGENFYISDTNFTSAEIDCSADQSILTLENKTVECGISHPDHTPIVSARARIINGQDAIPHSWPWQVSILQANGHHFCGGTLLRVGEYIEATDIVLTAAHCIDTSISRKKALADMVVKAGKHSLKIKEQGEEIRQSVAYKIYKGYDFPMHDIALLKVDKPIKFSDTIRPVCLPSYNQTLPLDQLCIIAGWGRMKDDVPTIPTKLQQLVMPLHSKEICERGWEKFSYDYNYWFCAGHRNGSAAGCYGDSGGMLVCKASNQSSWVQRGITSFASPTSCLSTDRLSGFTRVDYYIKWIEESMAKVSSLMPKKEKVPWSTVVKQYVKKFGDSIKNAFSKIGSIFPRG